MKQLIEIVQPLTVDVSKLIPRTIHLCHGTVNCGIIWKLYR
jgi:hypothetical protein